MSVPSNAAVGDVRDVLNHRLREGCSVALAREALEVAHDTTNFGDPLDASVCLRDVIEMLRKADPAHNDNYDLAADFIEREAQEGRL